MHNKFCAPICFANAATSGTLYEPSQDEIRQMLLAGYRQYTLENEHVVSFDTEIMFLGFAMDHGCHEIDGNCGSHGLDMLEDINIVHLYKGFRKEKQKYQSICNQTRKK